MHLYYITDRSAFPGDETARRRQLLEKIAEAARAGIDYIQLREKDLSAGDLETLAREVVSILREMRAETKLFLNSRTDIALAIEADGVHLRGDDISPREISDIQSHARRNSKLETRNLLIAVSCHSVDDVRRAELEGASFAVLAPIFDKRTAPTVQAVGLQGKLPVFALGGVTPENARVCLNTGATGIAAIRLFQDNSIEQVVRRLRRP